MARDVSHAGRYGFGRQRCGNLGKHFLAPARDANLCAIGNKPPRNSSSNPGAAPGHKRNLPFKSHYGISIKNARDSTDFTDFYNICNLC
jgi:hypothetical protein